MRVDTCDRCGSDILAGMNGTVTISADKQGYPGGSFDACVKCREELLAQFKTKPKGEVDLAELAKRCSEGDAEAIEQWNALSNDPWEDGDGTMGTPLEPEASDGEA